MAEETKIGMKLEEEAKPIKKMCEKLMDAVNHELDKGIENIDTKELGDAIDMIKDLYEAKEKLVKSCYYKTVIEAMEEHDFDDEEEIMEEGRRGYRGQPRSQSGRFMSRGDGRRSNRGRRGYETPMMMWDEDWDEMERMRDMDRMSYGRMGYSGSGSSGGSMGSTSSGTGSNQSSGGVSDGGQMGYSESTGGQYSSRNQRDNMNESRYDRAKRGYTETKSMHKDNSSESKQMKMKSLEDYAKSLTEDVTEMVSDMSAEEKNLLRTKLQTLAQKVQ